MVEHIIEVGKTVAGRTAVFVAFVACFETVAVVVVAVVTFVFVFVAGLSIGAAAVDYVGMLNVAYLTVYRED